MGMNPTSPRRQTETITVPDGGWSTPVRLQRLGLAGRITHWKFRAPATSTVTEVDVMVWVGDIDDDTEVTNPANSVPDENRIFYRTGITVAGSTTEADDDYVLSNPAIYDLVDRYAGPSGERDVLWFSVRAATSTADQANCVAEFRAQDVE